MADSANIGLLCASGTITSAQVKALNASPVQIIAAPGAGKVIQIITASGTMNYGGTNAFTAGASQTITVAYGTNITAATIVSNTALGNTSSGYNQVSPSITSTQPYSIIANGAVSLKNPVATEITGNAANNNTVSYNVVYRIITIP